MNLERNQKLQTQIFSVVCLIIGIVIFHFAKRGPQLKMLFFPSSISSSSRQAFSPADRAALVPNFRPLSPAPALHPPPPPEPATWKSGSYQLVMKPYGVIGFKHGSLTYYIALNSMAEVPCPDRGETFCLILPNGQFIVPSAELRRILPIRLTYRNSKHQPPRKLH